MGAEENNSVWLSVGIRDREQEEWFILSFGIVGGRVKM